jgi:hypothetical protein
MWAHYAENHSGIVLEFDDAHEWVRSHDFEKGQSRDRKDVLYQGKRTGWNGLIPRDEFLYTKSECWAYEKEVRLLRFFGDKDFLPNTVDSLVMFPPQLLRSVTLGVNNTAEDQVLHAITARPELAHVKLRKAEIHLDEYKLILIDHPIRPAV